MALFIHRIKGNTSLIEAPQFVTDERGNNVDVRVFIERVIDEREKALLQRFQAQSEALALARSNLEQRLEHLGKLDERIVSLEKRLMWMIVVGSLVVALAGLIGAAVGILAK